MENPTNGQFQKGNTSWNKGMKGFIHKGSFKKNHPQSNTGRTHFKKGLIPWSKLHPELMKPNKGSFKLGHQPANKDLELIKQETKELKLSEAQCAYLAGFIDADGCIQIEGKNGENKQSWTLSITLYNCDVAALEKMRDWINSGKVNCRDRNPEKWNKYYYLKYRAAIAAKLIKKLYPYFVVKKDQADVILEFLETFKRNNYEGSSWQGGRKVKEDTLRKRENLKKTLQSLTGTANYLGKNHA